MTAKSNPGNQTQQARHHHRRACFFGPRPYRLPHPQPPRRAFFFWIALLDAVILSERSESKDPQLHFASLCDNPSIPHHASPARSHRMKRLHLTLLLALALPLFACADDGAASIAAGGIVVLGREPRITMAKEVLHIAIDKVTVDYDFRNDSAEDITTEVAFPIPPYSFDIGDISPTQQGFDDFQLWIDGKLVHCDVQSRALVKGRDLTALLEKLHIDVASFGQFTEAGSSPEIRHLTPAQRKPLKQAGLIDATDDTPLWSVEKKYHWRQTFPAHSTVHIRHAYTPVFGGSNSIHYALGPEPDAQSAKELRSFCLDPRLKSALSRIANSKDQDAPYSYVDFILTSANTWKTPIEDFTLIVDRPHSKNSLANYVSFCWDGPVTKPDAGHFSAHATNLVPHRELRIGFFTAEKSRF